MSETVMRLGILLAVFALLWLLVWAVRLFIERQRRAVLALPASSAPALGDGSSIQILSFSTPDCRQCQTLQAPALERLLNTYGSHLKIRKVDAVQEPELAKQYRVITVPSTVVLDVQGQVQAVNYGFTPTPRLAEQIDALLEQQQAAS